MWHHLYIDAVASPVEALLGPWRLAQLAEDFAQQRGEHDFAILVRPDYDAEGVHFYFSPQCATFALAHDAEPCVAPQRYQELEHFFGDDTVITNLTTSPPKTTLSPLAAEEGGAVTDLELAAQLHLQQLLLEELFADRFSPNTRTLQEVLATVDGKLHFAESVRESDAGTANSGDRGAMRHRSLQLLEPFKRTIQERVSAELG